MRMQRHRHRRAINDNRDCHYPFPDLALDSGGIDLVAALIALALYLLCGVVSLGVIVFCFMLLFNL